MSTTLRHSAIEKRASSPSSPSGTAARARGAHSKRGSSASGWTRKDLTIGRALGIGFFLLYLAISRHAYIAYDANSMVAVTHNLVDHFTLRTTGAWHDYLKLSTPWSPYGVGLSVAIVPFFAVSRIFSNHEGLILSLYNPIVTAVTGALIYRIGRELRWNRATACFGAICYGVLTMALQSTTELFTEPTIALLTALLVLSFLRWQSGSNWAPLAIGIILGVAIQFRSDSIATLCVSLLSVPLFVSWKTVRRLSTLAKIFVPLALSLALLGWYNDVRWGKIFVSSYNMGGYKTPLLNGLDGLLFSWGKGLFVYNPIAIMGVVGLVVMFWRRRPLGVLFASIIVVRVVLFAKWTSWGGGVSYGPRLIMPIVVLLVISGVDLLNATASASKTTTKLVVRGGFALLIIPTLWINFLSVRVPYEQWWEVAATPRLRAMNPTAASLFHGVTHPGQIFTFTFGGSPLNGNYVLIADGQAKMAPELWLRGDGYLGWILIALSALALFAAAMLAAGFPRRRAEARTPASTPAPAPSH